MVEVNGQRYDAATGRLVGAVKQITKTVMPGSGQVMDGFTRRPAVTKITSSPAAKTVKAKAKRAAVSARRQPQPAKTLMRSFVSKPKLKLQDLKQKQALPKHHSVINSARAFRAKTVARNAHISHFIEKRKSQSDAESGEVISPSRVNLSAKGNSMALTRPNPTLATISGSQLERLLDQALERADAHRQNLRSRASGPLKFVQRLPRWLTVLILMVVVVGFGGIVAWQKVPQLSLKVASSRAHVDASIPGYVPYGFSLASPINYKSGSVDLTLRSAADNSKTVTITQTASNLDSQSLKSNVIPASTPVQTTQVNGTPVYIYGKSNNAVFKKGDSEVKITNNAQLPADELSNIAKGLLEQ